MNRHFKSDTWLLFITACIVIVGVLMVYSTTSIVTPQDMGIKESSYYDLVKLHYLKKHLFSLFTGIFLMVVSYKLNLRIIRKSANVLLIVSILIMIMIFIPGFGVTVNGATRWLRLGSFIFQPSELVKLTAIIFLARHLSNDNFKSEGISSFIVPFVVIGVIQWIFVKQPDFGAALIIGLLFFSMIFIAGFKMRFFVPLTVLLIPVLIELLREPYRFKRIVAFLNPESDPMGSGFQLIQSFIALGSGGIKGLGIGKSTQKLFFLPEAKTDFIFSIIGEEAGLIGAGIVVCLFFVFFIKGIMISYRTKEKFSFYLSTGIILMIISQVLINIAVVTGLLPTKGLTLPFISYGGSSLVINMISVGLLLNISRVSGVESEIEHFIKPQRRQGMEHLVELEESEIHY